MFKSDQIWYSSQEQQVPHKSQISPNWACSYKSADLLSTGQLFQFFQDGFDYTSTSGLRFSTVSGWLRLQFRLRTSGLRFQNNSALRAASSLYKSLYNCISLYKKAFKKIPRCARPFPCIDVFMTAFPFIRGLTNNFRVARGHLSS